jgi:hypothetical protein
MVVEVEAVEVMVVLVVIKEVMVVVVEDVQEDVAEAMVVLRPMLLPGRVVLRSLLLPQGIFHLSY